MQYFTCLSCFNWMRLYKFFLQKVRIRRFKKMFLKSVFNPVLKAPNVLEVIDFVLHVIYNQTSNEKGSGDSRCAMFFVKKGKNKVFNTTKYLLPDQHLLNMEILCAVFVGYSISSSMQSVYQALNPLDYGWYLRDGVNVPVGKTGCNSNLGRNKNLSRNELRKSY